MFGRLKTTYHINKLIKCCNIYAAYWEFMQALHLHTALSGVFEKDFLKSLNGGLDTSSQ